MEKKNTVVKVLVFAYSHPLLLSLTGCLNLGCKAVVYVTESLYLLVMELFLCARSNPMNELGASQIENVNYKQNRDQIVKLNTATRAASTAVASSAENRNKWQQNKQNDL